MSSNLALSVHNLCKEYRIAHQGERATTLSEALVSKIKKPLARTSYETFRALDDVSFEVEKGEVLGVIGRNGAGKSTLLKILSRITEPTYGEVRLFGRIGSLLEVGTGFHPELSGRENIFLNGAILGMRHKEIERQFDAIVDFAEVERFLDTPVKRYSSGMYVRLAFAVAAHLNPEILVVDEVLAVGDAQFQKKCLGKMQEVSQQDGRTVLFVSHNIGAIKALCTSCLLLDAGRVVFRGGTLEAAGLYSKMGLALTESGVRVDNGVTLREIKISETSNSRAMDSLHAYTDYLLSLHLEFSKPKEKIGVTITIRNEEDLAVSSICGPEEGIGWLAAKKSVHIEYSLPQLPLVPGKYSVDVDLFGLGGQVQFERALEFEVQETIAEGATASYNAQHGFFRIAQGGKVTIDSEAAEASIA